MKPLIQTEFRRGQGNVSRVDFAKVCLHESNIGLGVFAAQPIEAGEEILRLTGRIVGLEEVLAKGEEQSSMPVQIGYETYIDVDAPAMYLNHSCSPNAGLTKDTVLIALRPISRDEEIRFDYSTSMSEKMWTMRCLCESKNCRGIIEDFHYLPVEIKSHYLRLGIVQRFIVRECQQANLPLLLGGNHVTEQPHDPCLSSQRGRRNGRS